MSEAHKRSYRHPKYKTAYHVRNWAAYEKALRDRGDVTLWLSQDAIDAWTPPKTGKPGGQPLYSNIAIETALTLRLVFHLALCQAEGFLGSILKLMGLDLPCPDHTTLSRRNRTVRRGSPSLQTNVVYTRPKSPRTNDMRRESTKHLEMIDPVPMISGNITKFINEKIEKLDFHFFVEFGAGNSTRYFLKQIYNAKKDVNYISLEYNLRWFLKTVEAIKSDFNPLIHKPHHLKLTPWSYAKCKKYLGGKNLSQLKIPDHLKRLPKAKKKLAGILNYKMLTYRFSEKKRPSDGIFNITIGDLLKFDFILKKDFIKDQYGESPIKNEYIKAPFESLLKNIEKREKIIALFIIDGGPRFDILKRILDLEEKNKNFSPVIFLCDANRIFYNEQIKRRSNGVYIEGTNKTLNRGTMYENQTIDSADKVKFFYGKENISAHELIEKEVWYYNSVE